MKLMRYVVVLVASVGLGALSASAIPSTYELGSVPSVNLGDPLLQAVADTVAVNALVVAYDASVLLGAPLPAGSYVPSALLPLNISCNGPFTISNGGSGSYSVGLGGGGFTYALIDWGSTDEIYYIDGLTGSLPLVNDVNGSTPLYYDLFGCGDGTTSVPDGGTTAVLLGGALLSLAAVSARLRKATV